MDGLGEAIEADRTADGQGDARARRLRGSLRRFSMKRDGLWAFEADAAVARGASIHRSRRKS